MIAVEVEDEAWRDALADLEAVVVRAGDAALASDADAGAEPAAEVVVLLTDDAVVQALNARFRGKDRATNVLSFPAPESAAPHLGDIALASGVCQAEAEAQGKSLRDHLTHLVVHGVLHLLGLDHEDEGEAEAMEATERRLLEGLGVTDPYRVDAAHG